MGARKSARKSLQFPWPGAPPAAGVQSTPSRPLSAGAPNVLCRDWRPRGGIPEGSANFPPHAPLARRRLCRGRPPGAAPATPGCRSASPRRRAAAQGVLPAANVAGARSRATGGARAQPGATSRRGRLLPRPRWGFYFRFRESGPRPRLRRAGDRGRLGPPAASGTVTSAPAAAAGPLRVSSLLSRPSAAPSAAPGEPGGRDRAAPTARAEPRTWAQHRSLCSAGPPFPPGQRAGDTPLFGIWKGRRSRFRREGGVRCFQGLTARAPGQPWVPVPASLIVTAGPWPALRLPVKCG